MTFYLLLFFLTLFRPSKQTFFSLFCSLFRLSHPFISQFTSTQRCTSLVSFFWLFAFTAITHTLNLYPSSSDHESSTHSSLLHPHPHPIPLVLLWTTEHSHPSHILFIHTPVFRHSFIYVMLVMTPVQHYPFFPFLFSTPLLLSVLDWPSKRNWTNRIEQSNSLWLVWYCYNSFFVDTVLG